MVKTRWEQWRLRNGDGGPFRIGGHVGEAFNTRNRKTLEAHPEYFAELGGQRQPWALAKSDDPAAAQQLDETLYTLADTVRVLGVLLYPYIPQAAATILGSVGEPGAVSWDRAAHGGLAAGTATPQPAPIFPRVAADG